MTEQEMEAIVGGFHGDPFSVLGPHPVSSSSKLGDWEIRAFLPQAKSAVIQSPAGDSPMERIHPHGLFAARVPHSPGAYTISYIDFHAQQHTIEDPYRFGPQLSSFDLHLHTEGTQYEGYRSLGAHLITVDGIAGTRFAVWAPNAIIVSVVGSFNEWDSRRHPMRARTGGVWEIFLPGILAGAAYKYAIKGKYRGYSQMKSDPYGFQMEKPPQSASIVADIWRHEWNDSKWLEERAKTRILDKPLAIYEVHLGSWLRGENFESLSYRDLAAKLIPYVKRLGYTHIELMPIMEHPYTGSWGYQVIGYFAPTARFGTPEDFMYFIDQCHQNGVGVLVDWVPGHFPKDAHGLAWFDGTAVYEHSDPRRGEQPEWGTNVFNFGRNEVRSFLISNALFWIKQYHLDGLRVDAVASMLYLDFSREPGEWIPNIHGGRENLEAIDFLRKTNELVHKIPGAVTIAEESSSFYGVSRPLYLNGLGFTMKWNMGWMHDMFDYFSMDPIYRKYHQKHVTFSIMYAFSENFVLPISHDEVVYGKRSLLSKMPGDEWQRFANARAFLAYMYAHPGKKLLFMGCEIGQTWEWNHDDQVQWHLLDHEIHRQFQTFNIALNQIYQSEPALWEVDFQYAGFEWIDLHDVESSVISFIRRGKRHDNYLVVVCNFTPQPHHNYRIGFPEAGEHREIFNSDASYFGGSNMGNGGAVIAEPVPKHHRAASAALVLPPLSVVVFKPTRPLPPLLEPKRAGAKREPTKTEQGESESSKTEPTP
jgi:1,4-alpha-glucan branching enzyme